MADPSTPPVYDPTGKNVPILPEPEPPTGTAVAPSESDAEPPPRREGVVCNPDAPPEASRP